MIRRNLTIRKLTILCEAILVWQKTSRIFFIYRILSKFTAIQKNLYTPLPSQAYRFFLILPSNHFINDFLLLGRAAVQVDACGFDAFVFHKVGKERDVVELFEKVLGEVMSQ